MARELRLSAAREDKEARDRRARTGANLYQELGRGGSFSPGSTSSLLSGDPFFGARGLSPAASSTGTDPLWFNSMPRSSRPPVAVSPTGNGDAGFRPRTGFFTVKPAGAAATVQRHGSFQHQKPKVDVYRGRVDFKDTLRQFDPKDEERSSGGGVRRPQHHPRSSLECSSLNMPSYHSYYDPMPAGGPTFDRPWPPRRGTIVESDFDFRGSAPALTSAGATRPAALLNRLQSATTAAAAPAGGFLLPGQVQPQAGRVQTRSCHNSDFALGSNVSSSLIASPASSTWGGSTTNNINSAFPVHHSRQPLKLGMGFPFVQKGLAVLPRDLLSNPSSPRRVEFAEQVFFSLDEQQSERAVSPSSGGSSSLKKSILRRTNSNDATDSRRSPSSRPLSLIEQFEHQEMERRMQHQFLKHHHQQQEQRHQSDGREGAALPLLAQQPLRPMAQLPPLTINDEILGRTDVVLQSPEAPKGVAAADKRSSSSSTTRKESLVKIYVPPSKPDLRKIDNKGPQGKEYTLPTGPRRQQEWDGPGSEAAAASSSDDETLSAGSDLDNHEDDEGHPSIQEASTSNGDDEKSQEGRRASSDMAQVMRRKVPPRIGDWYRSQSFPPPTSVSKQAADPDQSSAAGQGRDETGAFVEGLPRKPSSPLTSSEPSLADDSEALKAGE